MSPGWGSPNSYGICGRSRISAPSGSNPGQGSFFRSGKTPSAFFRKNLAKNGQKFGLWGRFWPFLVILKVKTGKAGFGQVLGKSRALGKKLRFLPGWLDAARLSFCFAKLVKRLTFLKASPKTFGFGRSQLLRSWRARFRLIFRQGSDLWRDSLRSQVRNIFCEGAQESRRNVPAWLEFVARARG